MILPSHLGSGNELSRIFAELHAVKTVFRAARSCMRRWVPLDWLTQWANAAAGVPAVKGALLCKDHSKLDPGKVTGEASLMASFKSHI